MTGRIVFVTGGAGFIGSNIVARLAEDRSLDVVVCDWLGQVELGKWRNISKHAIADFVPPEAMFEWLEKRWRDVEAVIHMGAISSTTEPDADALITTNFCLSRDLFRWCAERQRRFIYASSAATYGGGANGFSDRDDLDSLIALRPLNPYGWSKALFDIFAAREAARGAAPPQWVGLKFFNVYGPNEEHKGSMRSVVAQIWPKVAAGETVRLFKSGRADVADGEQKRDFVYVRDAADVVAWLAANPAVNGVYNLGSGKARSFKDLALAVFRTSNREPNIEYVDPPGTIAGHYQYFTQADMTRLGAAGYTAPLTGLEDGIADYVTRYLATADPHR
jgi:ADP-L-glycero-D-manno-heptose 6-epimerase